MTRALAKELAPSSIQVNAIACGAIDTEMNQFLDEEERNALLEEIPAGRMGRAEEVGKLAYQLGSEDSYSVPGSSSSPIASQVPCVPPPETAHGTIPR